MVTISPPKSLDRKKANWHTLEIPTVLSSLHSDPEVGLSTSLVRKKLNLFGANELKRGKIKPWWLKFLLQFNQPLIYILLAAGAVKALLGEWINAGVIWGVTTTNAAIGYLQEAKAEGAIAALASSVTTESTVVRNGKKMCIPSRELVPGDLVLLNSGDKVPADLRLLKVRSLQIDESAITGESVAVEKSTEPLEDDIPLGDRRNMAYAGGLVTFGQGKGVVVATGKNTETGKISQLLENPSFSTPLTRKLEKFSKKWLYLVLGLATLTFFVGWNFRGFKEALEAAVALTVSAIPEGLPAVITVTLAIGVGRMAKRHAIIRKLPAVETLGSTTVICSDKTGTLTKNQMTVQEIFAGGNNYSVIGAGYSLNGEILFNGYSIDLNKHITLRECLVAGLLCNDSHLEYKENKWVAIGDPTETALIVAGKKGGLSQSELEKKMPRQDSIPFESEYKYMATLHQTSLGKIAYIKGAVEVILPRCHVALDRQGNYVELDRKQVQKQVKLMAERGLRVLALAKKPFLLKQQEIAHTDVQEALIFLGLQGAIDPPRESAIEAVKACHRAGIEVKMITGDHVVTASAIARQMGIHKNGDTIAFTGSQLANMDSVELATAANKGSVFARVAPEQKLDLVKALQAKGEIVAMTGDGVNDAPALKQADIGVAMGHGGTEVAKEASDMLLTDDNFASIEAAVEEGRAVYRNLLKAITFILPVNVGESMSILIATLLARDLPILSLQILWLNMLNSITMTVPLAFEPKSSKVMEAKPRNPNEPILSGSRLQRILAIALFNLIVIFGVFEYVRSTTGDLALARTMAVNALIAGRIFYLLSISQLVPNFIAKINGVNKNQNTDIPAIGLGIVGAIAFQFIFTYVPFINEVFATAPLNLNQWLFCLAVSLPMIPWSAFVNRLDPPN
ncbi:MAG: HAD-IC family P-type ATPase [Prochloraceae cyanobacterium]|nr:HAD-IC family P-type ATPase [Prochloraceae cyanobacterium]